MLVQQRTLFCALSCVIGLLIEPLGPTLLRSAEVSLECNVLYEIPDGIYVSVSRESKLAKGDTGWLARSGQDLVGVEVLSVSRESAFLRFIGQRPKDFPAAGEQVTLSFTRVAPLEEPAPRRPSQTLKDRGSADEPHVPLSLGEVRAPPLQGPARAAEEPPQGGEKPGATSLPKTEEPSAGDKPLVPLLAPETPKVTAFTDAYNISQGQVSLRQLFQLTGGKNLNYSETHLRSTGSLERIEATPWAFEWSGDISYRNGKALENVEDFREVRLELYRAAFFRKYDDQSWVRVGRFLPRELPSAGYLDGAQGEWDRRKGFFEIGSLDMNRNRTLRAPPAPKCPFLLLLALTASGCWKGNSGDSVTTMSEITAESCMSCHNGAAHDDYAGSGLENPHPFPGAATLKCTQCHGGNGSPRASMASSHIPPPPEIGSEKDRKKDAKAYFNRLTLAGIDKFADYQDHGKTYSALDYLEFVNPGDLRVVTQGRGCGRCHAPHAEASSRSPLATEMGILSSSMYTLGLTNAVPENQGLYGDTASDYSFRAVTNPDFQFDPANVGALGRLSEFPVHSVFGDQGALAIFNNPLYDAANLPNYVNADNSIQPNSPLAHLFQEQVSFTCGDCHLGSSGANNRYGDFRSSGCTACHMRYSQDGRSHSSDSHIKKKEPANPDAIKTPERPHVQRHLVKSIARTLATGETVKGIDDHTCAGCHQGSNRTVMQYWGIRLDQNADLRNRVQYPANPVSFRNTARDTRLFDPVVENRTFNGRNPNQYILEEDYDGDGRDDTPADVHYEAGLGCIDCHGSHDIHGGTVATPSIAPINSRQEQAVAIRCESCHGTIEAYAATQSCVTYDGLAADCAVDFEGNVVKNVTRDANGNYFLKSRLDGRVHYIKQTKDVIANSGKVHPTTSQPVYNAKASYAMGRADGDPSNGIGPKQTNSSLVQAGFSHTDSMSCVACHASWTNNCIGCHLIGEYNTGNNFSNITGERIVYKQANADFTYQTPVPFQLGVSTHNEISVMSPNTLVFYQWKDRRGDFSRVFAFTDRNGFGNNPGASGQNAFPSLSHNVMMPHSIRGRVASDKEGPRYCVACHLTQDALTNFGPEYDSFRAAMAANNFAALDFPLLKVHIGQNTSNQLNSPFWVHMVAGLGSGLFLFDADGCPVNPLDTNPNRVGCNGTAPATKYDLARVTLDLDRIVEPTGVPNSSSNHVFLSTAQASQKRDGAPNQGFAGPLGATLIQRLSDPVNGIVLDSWIDADGQVDGDAAGFVGN